MTFLLLGTLLALANSDGGVINGGGGRAVVCYDTQEKIESAEMLDLYEGTRHWGYRIAKSQQDIDAQISRAAKNASSNGSLIKILSEGVRKKLHAIPKTDRLKLIDDSHHSVIPSHCKIEQVAIFVNKDRILFDQRIWEQMSNTDRAAMLVHEAYYNMLERPLGVSDSRRSRKLVGRLFSSENPLTKLTEGIVTEPRRCIGSSSDKKSVMFYLHKEQDIWKLQFLSVGTRPMVDRAVLQIWDFDNKWDFVTRVVPGSPGNYRTTGDFIQSEFDDQTFVTVKSSWVAVRDYQTGEIIPGYKYKQFSLSVSNQWGDDYRDIIFNCDACWVDEFNNYNCDESSETQVVKQLPIKWQQQ